MSFKEPNYIIKISTCKRTKLKSNLKSYKVIITIIIRMFLLVVFVASGFVLSFAKLLNIYTCIVI